MLGNNPPAAIVHCADCGKDDPGASMYVGTSGHLVDLCWPCFYVLIGIPKAPGYIANGVQNIGTDRRSDNGK